MIEVRELVKDYGTRRALPGISFQVRNGRGVVSSPSERATMTNPETVFPLTVHRPGSEGCVSGVPTRTRRTFPSEQTASTATT